jgi:hypothetical protein
MEGKGLKLSEIDSLGGRALNVVEGKATATIHFNSCGALDLKLVVAGQLEFQY